MDTFSDKLAQKQNAQEFILANAAAEAVKMEQMQKQMEIYDELLQEMRKVNLKMAENASEEQRLLKECTEKVEAMQPAEQVKEEDGRQLTDLKEMMDERFKQSDDFLHRENVKVYRNVQAAMVDELHKQTEEWKALQGGKKGNGTVTVLLVLILLGVAANLALNVINYLGIVF